MQVTVQNTDAKKINRKLCFLFVIFFSCVGMFGQTMQKESDTLSKVEVSFATEVKMVSVESQIDFVSWFMGSKQPQIKSESTEVKNNTSRGITKKQILSLGISPNKVLYRTFMKKVSSQDSAIV